MSFKRVPFLSVFYALVAITSLFPQSPSDSPVPGLRAGQSESEIARVLAVQGQFIPLPVEGHVKQLIEKGAKPFVLPTGESRVLLFKLPDYSAPYSLKITSVCNHGCLGWSKSVFVPSVVFLDAEFQPTRKLDETEFENQFASAWKTYRVETAVSIDSPQRADRYLLLYTIGKEVGEVWFTFPQRGLMEGSEVRASEVGSLELEVRPEDRNLLETKAKRAKDALATQKLESRRVEVESVLAAQAVAGPAESAPLEPEMQFPAQALAAFVRSPRFLTFDVWVSEGGDYGLLTIARNPRLHGSGSDLYQFQAGRYNVLVTTPIVEWYLNERDAIRAQREEAKRQKKAWGAPDVGQPEWGWFKYESRFQNVVHVRAIPEFCQTTASLLLSGIAKAVTQLKYKTSLAEMSLLCDGREIQAVDRKRFPVKLPEGYGTPEGAVALAGDYEYSFDAFDTNRCRNLELRIVSEDHSDNDARAIPAKTLRQVRTDFEGVSKRHPVQ